jgi:hypothetical protein
MPMKGTYQKNKALVTALAALGLILVVLGRAQRRASA